MAAMTIIQNLGKVSSSTCKDLGNHHSALKIRKKLNRPKNQKILLDFKRGENIGQTPAPKIGETDRQIQGVMAYWSRDSQGETSVGTRARNQCQGGKLDL